MSQITLLYLESVEQFFQTYNWEGKRKETKQELKEEPTLSVCLKLEEFFSRSNWEGKPLTLTKETTKAEVLITQKVKNFFAYMSWEGKPKIAKIPTPPVQIIQAADLSSSAMNLNDLSDLF